MPSGGKIAPDGRPPVAPGVGKTARRHDLEAPATPGLSDPSIQQGDVQRLEQAQRVAPRRKRTQPPAAPQSKQPRQPAGGQQTMDVPDPIAMASGRIGGQVIPPMSAETEPLDVERWRPLMRELARNPHVSGPLTTTLFAQLTNMQNLPGSSGVRVVDQNAIDAVLTEGT